LGGGGGKGLKKEAVRCGVRQPRTVEWSAPSVTRAAPDDDGKKNGPRRGTAGRRNLDWALRGYSGDVTIRVGKNVMGIECVEKWKLGWLSLGRRC